VIQISLRSRQGFRPHDYVKYNTFVTFLCMACFPFVPFILFSCSPPQVKRVNQFPWLSAQTMRFHPRKCLFGVSLKKFEFTGSVTPKTAKKWAWSMVSQPNSENQQKLISQSHQEISTQNLNCRWKQKRTHYILGQRSPIA
jgi:hypothetical protein